MTVASIIAVLLLIAAALMDRKLKRDSERLLVRLGTMLCPECNQPFGVQAARSAAEEHTRRCQEAREANPGHRINFAMVWTVVCSHCETKSYFAPETIVLDRDFDEVLSKSKRSWIKT